MKRKIILYISVSLDGFIAREDGAIDWLEGNGEEDNIDNGYEEFSDSIDTIIMGRTTYEQVITELSPDIWPYEGKKTYVLTSKDMSEDKNVEFIDEDIPRLVEDIKKDKGKDIWVLGGGKLIDGFIKNDLIDKYMITIIPKILGKGIPLFIKDNPEIKLRNVGSRNTDGMIELSYIRE